VVSADIPPPTSTRHALVWGNAFVYATASPDGPKARMRSYPDNARASHLGDVWPVEVVDDGGELVKIRTLGGEDVDHCYRGPSLLNAFSLVLHVARSDLAPVLQTPVVASFEDGTWVAINAGVSVSPLDRVATADGLRVPVPADAKVGTTYNHAKRFDTRAVERQTRTAILVNGELLSEDALTSFPVLASKALETGAMVSVLTGCMQVDARAAAAPQLVPYHPIDASDAASQAAPKTAKHFPIGTTLYFKDRRMAGETVDAIAMSLLDKDGEMLCFQRSLSEYSPGEPTPEHHVLELCVASGDAREKAQRRAIWPMSTTPPRNRPN
jgi:hypothetical protein